MSIKINCCCNICAEAFSPRSSPHALILIRLHTALHSLMSLTLHLGASALRALGEVLAEIKLTIYLGNPEIPVKFDWQKKINRHSLCVRKFQSQNRKGKIVNKIEWLTLDQTCDFLGISRSTLNDWRIKDKAPQFLKLPNGQLRIKRLVLETWVENLPVVS